MNHYIAIGNITWMEMQTVKEHEVLNFAVAIKCPWDSKNKTDFFLKCSAWNDMGFRIKEHFKVGKPIRIHGELEPNQYEKDSQVFNDFKCKVRHWAFVDSHGYKKDDEPVEKDKSESQPY